MTSASATLGTLLRHLVELTDGDVETAYRELGLDYRPRFTPIVRALARLGPSPIRTLAEVAGVTHSAASQTVAEMVRRGLVTLAAGKDARERLASLTPEATALLPTLRSCWAATNAAAADLDRELGTELGPLLARAIECLERRPFLDRLMTFRADSGPAATPIPSRQE